MICRKAQEVQLRQQRLLREMPSKSLGIVFPMPPVPFQHDFALAFKQSSTFEYLTGFGSAVSSVALITKNDRSETVTILESNVSDNLSTALRSALRTRPKCFVMWPAVVVAPGFDLLATRIQEAAEVARLELVRHGYRIESDFVSPLKLERTKTRHEVQSGHSRSTFESEDFRLVENLESFVQKLRLVKSEFELEKLRLSGRATVEAIERVRHITITRSVTELAVEAELALAAADLGFRFGFPPVVARGKHTTLLHHRAEAEWCRDSQWIVDAGICVDSYTCDCTRSWNTNAKSPVYNQCLREIELASADIIAGCRVGRKLEDINEEGKKRLEIAAAKCTLPNKRLGISHAVVHFVGLDIHEKADPLETLKAGMVVAVEPGLYFDCWGLRHEDTIEISDHGNITLTK